MKEFDLEAAKAGKKVQLRSGREARIICFDRKDPVMPIVVLAKDDEGVENVHYYTPNGKRAADQPYLDLVMATEKKVGWVNLYEDTTKRPASFFLCFNSYDVFDTEENALADIDPKRNDEYRGTAKIEWEE